MCLELLAIWERTQDCVAHDEHMKLEPSIFKSQSLREFKSMATKLLPLV